MVPTSIGFTVSWRRKILNNYKNKNITLLCRKKKKTWLPWAISQRLLILSGRIKRYISHHLINNNQSYFGEWSIRKSRLCSLYRHSSDIWKRRTGKEVWRTRARIGMNFHFRDQKLPYAKTSKMWSCRKKMKVTVLVWEDPGPTWYCSWFSTQYGFKDHLMGFLANLYINCGLRRKWWIQHCPPIPGAQTFSSFLFPFLLSFFFTRDWTQGHWKVLSDSLSLHCFSVADSYIFPFC